MSFLGVLLPGDVSRARSLTGLKGAERLRRKRRTRMRVIGFLLGLFTLAGAIAYVGYSSYANSIEQAHRPGPAPQIPADAPRAHPLTPAVFNQGPTYNSDLIEGQSGTLNRVHSAPGMQFGEEPRIEEWPIGGSPEGAQPDQGSGAGPSDGDPHSALRGGLSLGGYSSQYGSGGSGYSY